MRRRHNDASPAAHSVGNGQRQGGERAFQCGENPAEDSTAIRSDRDPTTGQTYTRQIDDRRRCRR